MRLWERALRRASLPLAYSQGFSPHPRISLAAPLALGITSEAELMEFQLSRPVAPNLLLAAIAAQMPRGLSVMEANPVHPTAPSLPSLVRWAEYRVVVETDKEPSEIEAAIQALLSAQSLPWQHSRDTGVRAYDLRPLIAELKLAEWQPGKVSLEMKLRCDNLGSGRPEQVTAALHLPQRPTSIHRTKLILSNTPAA